MRRAQTGRVTNRLVIHPDTRLPVRTFQRQSDPTARPARGDVDVSLIPGGTLVVSLRLQPERYLDLTGPIVSALIVRPEDEVTLVTADGMALHTEVETIPEASRTARGQIVMNVYKGDRLGAVARLRAGIQQLDVA